APRALRANLRPTYRQGRPHRRLAVKPGRLALLTFRHREVVRSIPWHVRSGPAPKADLAAAPEVPLLGTCGASCFGQVDGADVADVSAGVAKSVYALDLKSSPCKGLRVRAPPPAHYRSDGLGRTGSSPAVPHPSRNGARCASGAAPDRRLRP